ncbi:MAG: hypothetical protein J6Y78_09140 [Paludibacteraceae bacterium]|nr:hypothetical protein [Paludibacteraceae bacterium]
MKKIGVLLTVLAMVFMSCEQPLSEDYLREVISGMMTEENGSSNETTPIEITWEKVDDSGIIPTKNEDGYYEFYLNSYKYQYNMNEWYYDQNNDIPPMYSELMSNGMVPMNDVRRDNVFKGIENKVFIEKGANIKIYTGIRWSSSEPCYLQLFSLKEGLYISSTIMNNVEKTAGEIVIKLVNNSNTDYELCIGDAIAKVFVVPLVYPTTAKVKE